MEDKIEVPVKDSVNKYSLVLDKNTLVVEKKEQWDPEHESVDYEITLIADCACSEGGPKKNDHIRLVITTDDAYIANKFSCGKEVDIKCTQTILHKTNIRHGVQ